MRRYFIGHHHGTRQKFHLPRPSFDTHYHLIGGTGKGKTTLIHAILHSLLMDPTYRASVFIIDKMGGLSTELLMWMASPYCPQAIRNRLVYMEPSREDVVLPFNPLLFTTLAEGYYKVSRAMEIALRGWASQNIEEMPRLARWMWNVFWAAAQLGLTIADCAHFLMPGSELHKPLIAALPDLLRAEWEHIYASRSGDEARTLESTRNRLKPYFDCPPLRQMFAGTESRLDVLRFMREGKIVVLNLAPYNRLPELNANAIGGMVINEIISVARSLPMGVRFPTYLVLDEFQNFVGPDIEAAIPEVRQLGLKMIFSHQSFSQLQQGDTDLSSIIFQCQSRGVFGVQGEDADLLAHEFASLGFDPYVIKDVIYSRQQRLTGHKIIDLQSKSFTQQQAENWTRTVGDSWSANSSHSRKAMGMDWGTRSTGDSRGGMSSDGQGGGSTSGQTSGSHETLVPIYEDIEQLTKRVFFSFEEQRAEWARDIRTLARGVAYIRLVDDPAVYHIDVQRSALGPLAWPAEKLLKYYPQALDRLEELKATNFHLDYFLAPSDIERQTRERLERVLRPVIHLTSGPKQLPLRTDHEVPGDSEFS